MDTRTESLGSLVKETVDGLGHLVAEHVRLAKLELLEDLESMIRQAAHVAVVVAFGFVGYLFLCAGGVALLAPTLGTANAAFLVGGVHAALGALGLVLSLAKLSRTRVMDGTALEVHRTVSALSAGSHSRTQSRAG